MPKPNDLRERFERWALAQGWNIARRDVGDYQTLSTDAAWGAWLGCAADAEEHHSKLCAEWSSICRSSRRHGASVGANECANLIRGHRVGVEFGG